MASLNVIFSQFIFIIFILPIYARNPCESSQCNNGGLEIRFPFLLTSQQDKTCGYPGFGLTCTNGLPTIDLPFSGSFFIREINYKTQIIKLYDPKNCLPGRMLELNLSSSPFMGNTYKNYSFFNCPVSYKNLTTYLPFVVNCLSNSTNIVMAIYVENVTTYVMQNCDKIETVPIPLLGNDWFSGDEFSYLWLTWYKPRCEPCEKNGGVCGLKSVGTLDVGCMFTQPGLSAIKIVFMAVIFPAIVLFSCYLIIKYSRNNINRQDINNSVHITTQRGLGLDDSTIQSYTKVIIGESNRIPGINDGTCPICLSEFLAKETVRFIPDCTHSFHSDCIDEWLRLNHSCPVCRSSPT